MEDNATAEIVPKKNLTAKQRAGVEALLTTKSKADAARVAGVARRTITRWLAMPHFQASLAVAEADALKGLSRNLGRLADMTIDALEAALIAKEMRYRLRASEIVLGRLLQLRELVDIEQRITELETRLL